MEERGRETKPKKKRLWIALAAVCGCVVVASLGYIGHYLWNSYTNKSMNSKLADLYDSLGGNYDAYSYIEPEKPAPLNLNDPSQPAAGAEAGGGEGPEIRPFAAEMQRLRKEEQSGRFRFREFLEINEDFLGMLIIDGLDVKLPFVHAEDNKKYLKRSFEGKESGHGTVFLHSGNSPYFINSNNVIFGHRMNDGTMFYPLLKYQEPATVEKAPVIMLDTLSGKTSWVVFAAYTCEPYWGYANTLYNGIDFEWMLEEIEQRSLITTNVEVTAKDRLLTLSTCTYDFEDARFVVHARMLRDGEQIEVTAEKSEDARAAAVPKQLNFSDMRANQTALMLHPDNGKIYYYQSRGDGVNWYVGDTNKVQGPYSAFTGNFASDSTMSVLYDKKNKAPFMAIDRMSGTPGIFLMTAKIASSAFGQYSLVKNTPVTPQGVDARYPLLLLDGGEMSLLYAAPDGVNECIYRMRVNNLGDATGGPELLISAPAGSRLRPVAYFYHDGGTVLIWQEASGVYSLRVGSGESVTLPMVSTWDRITLYGAMSSDGAMPMILEKGGKLSAGTFLAEWLNPAPPPPEIDETEPPPEIDETPPEDTEPPPAD